jgi:hypothetical protein
MLKLPRHRRRCGNTTLPRHGAWRGKTALLRLSSKTTSMVARTPRPKIEQCGCFKLSRHRAWHGRAYMVTSLETEPGDLLCRATPHGVVEQHSRAVEHGAAV